jgi:rubredoxin
MGKWSALGKAAMSNEQNIPRETSIPTHPICPTCGVRMWLTRIESAASQMLPERLHYECKVCDAVAMLPSQT